MWESHTSIQTILHKIFSNPPPISKNNNNNNEELIENYYYEQESKLLESITSIIILVKIDNYKEIFTGNNRSIVKDRVVGLRFFYHCIAHFIVFIELLKSILSEIERLCKEKPPSFITTSPSQQQQQQQIHHHLPSPSLISKYRRDELPSLVKLCDKLRKNYSDQYILRFKVTIHHYLSNSSSNNNGNGSNGGNGNHLNGSTGISGKGGSIGNNSGASIEYYFNGDKTIEFQEDGIVISPIGINKKSIKYTEFSLRPRYIDMDIDNPNQNLCFYTNSYQFYFNSIQQQISSSEILSVYDSIISSKSIVFPNCSSCSFKTYFLFNCGKCNQQICQLCSVSYQCYQCYLPMKPIPLYVNYCEWNQELKIRSTNFRDLCTDIYRSFNLPKGRLFFYYFADQKDIYISNILNLLSLKKTIEDTSKKSNHVAILDIRDQEPNIASIPLIPSTCFELVTGEPVRDGNKGGHGLIHKIRVSSPLYPELNGLALVLKKMKMMPTNQVNKPRLESEPFYLYIQQSIERFRNEASYLGHLSQNCPYIVKIYGFVESQDMMAFILEEATLGSIHNKRYSSWPLILLMLGDICKGMIQVHGYGLIHRDLKPDNILLFSESLDKDQIRCKIADFGISTPIQKPHDLYHTGSQHTPCYDAPEHGVHGKFTDNNNNRNMAILNTITKIGNPTNIIYCGTIISSTSLSNNSQSNTIVSSKVNRKHKGSGTCNSAKDIDLDVDIDANNSIACTTAYPTCVYIPLKSCCEGQEGVCVHSVNNYASDYSNDTNQPVTSCVQHSVQLTIFEIRGHVLDNFTFEGFVRYPPPNATCESLQCEDKGLMCVLDPASPCISESPCCQPISKCVENLNFDSHKRFDSDKICDITCPEGYSCRYITEQQTCLPTRCDLLSCAPGTECIILEGVGIASCFLSIEFEETINLPIPDDCSKKACPMNYTCGKGVFSNSDCVPENIDLLAFNFNCSDCPSGICTNLASGGLCIDWQPNSQSQGDLCQNGKCLYRQYCNTTSGQCEFDRCQPDTCGPGLQCVQYQPTHPRVCATSSVIPFAVEDCVGLTLEECGSSYPSCTFIPLPSCCEGQEGVCVSTKSNFFNDNFSNIPGVPVSECLRNNILGTIFEIRGHQLDEYNFNGYTRYLPPNSTCESLQCEERGLMCVREPSTPCTSTSVCCQPVSRCVENLIFDSHKKFNATLCETKCRANYTCRVISEVEVCLPTNCDLLECEPGSQCIVLDIGIASCFLITKLGFGDDEINSNHIVLEDCSTKQCPMNYTCRKGLFSDADCVPQNLDILGFEFQCDQCPEGFFCDSYGFGGLCMEWHPESSYYDGNVSCLNETCIENQFCNSTSGQCEYTSCQPDTCGPGLICIQYHPTVPKTCVTTNVVPYGSPPLNILPYLQFSTRAGYVYRQ
eukprot:gene809-1005_t